MNQSSLKVVIIGGGSSYTPEILEGIINRHNQFPVSEIVLVDIEEGKHKLDIIYKLASRMVSKSGIKCKISSSLNLQESLKGASFVATQFRVGLLDARALDERIPLSYGMIGQETNGAGGFMKALRTIPVILNICREMEKICPDAWLINFTNPASMVTEAVLKHTNIKCIGLCNVPVLYQKMASHYLQAPQEDVFVQMSGINHYSWVKHVYYNGKDYKDELLNYYLEATDNKFNPANITGYPFIKEHIKSLGVIPSPYHMYYYLTNEVLNKDIENYKQNGTRAEVVQETEKRLFELYKNEDLKEKPKELEERGGAYYSDVACSIMLSIYNNSNIHMIVNTINNGTISCLPEDCVIETTCIINASGALPVTVDSFPKQLSAELVVMKTFEQLTIEAAITGDVGVALQALTLNPLVRSGHEAVLMFNDLIKAHIKYLPQFQEYYNKIK